MVSLLVSNNFAIKYQSNLSKIICCPISAKLSWFICGVCLVAHEIHKAKHPISVVYLKQPRDTPAICLRLNKHHFLEWKWTDLLLIFLMFLFPLQVLSHRTIVCDPTISCRRNSEEAKASGMCFLFVPFRYESPVWSGEGWNIKQNLV